MMRAITALVLVVLGGCRVETDHAAEAPLVAPTPDLADAHAVAVHDLHRGSWCSGYIIGRAAVLTAKHCIQSPGEPVPFLADLRVGVGATLDHPVGWVRVSGATLSAGAFEEPSDLRGDDWAVLRLEEAVDFESADLEIGVAPPMGTVFAAGLGRTPGGTVGLWGSAAASVVRLEEGEIVVHAVTCAGDSGGPLLSSTGALLGVASWRSPGRCGIGVSGFTAAYEHEVEIQRAAQLPACRTGGEACPGDGRARDSDSCVADADCASDRCVARACAARCVPWASPAGCRAGEVCVQGALGSWCATVAGAIPLGGPCAASDQCASGVCSDGACATPCHPDLAECSDNETEECSETEAAGTVCVPATATPRCGAIDCPAGYVCDGGSCVAGVAVDGERCDPSVGCGIGLACFDMDGESRCGRDCREDADCGGDARCDNGACAAKSAIGQSCTAEVDCASGSCTDGVCSRTCRGELECAVPDSCDIDGYCQPGVRVSDCSSSGGSRGANGFAGIVLLCGAALIGRRGRSRARFLGRSVAQAGGHRGDTSTGEMTTS